MRKTKFKKIRRDDLHKIISRLHRGWAESVSFNDEIFLFGQRNNYQGTQKILRGVTTSTLQFFNVNIYNKAPAK